MKKLFLPVALILLFTLTSVMPVSAAPAASVNVFSETFDNPIQYRLPGVPSTYPWWAITDNDFQQYYGSACDPENVNCLTRELESGDYFARFSKGVDPTPFGYNNIELSELQTGWVFGQGQEQWCPTPGHPVVISEKVRFGTNYNEDGSGGAVGTAGGGFWNSYPDFPNQTFHPIKAIWWSWTEQGSAFGSIEGLMVNVVDQTNNVFYINNLRAPAIPLNMQDWMTFTTAWVQLPQNQQFVQFYVSQNGNTYNAGSVTVPNMGCLSVTHWNDNTFISGFDQNGFPVVTYHNPTQADVWDLTSVTVAQH